MSNPPNADEPVEPDEAVEPESDAEEQVLDGIEQLLTPEPDDSPTADTDAPPPG